MSKKMLKSLLIASFLTCCLSTKLATAMDKAYFERERAALEQQKKQSAALELAYRKGREERDKELQKEGENARIVREKREKS